MVEQKSKTVGQNTKLKRRKVASPQKKSFHIFQDPLYRALVALGLGHKIQINVMASLEMKEVKAAFMDSFYSACKGQPSKGWDKYHHLMNIISEQHYHHRCIVIHEAFQLLASGIKDRDKMRKMSKHC